MRLYHHIPYCEAQLAARFLFQREGRPYAAFVKKPRIEGCFVFLLLDETPPALPTPSFQLLLFLPFNAARASVEGASVAPALVLCALSLPPTASFSNNPALGVALSDAAAAESTALPLPCAGFRRLGLGAAVVASSSDAVLVSGSSSAYFAAGFLCREDRRTSGDSAAAACGRSAHGGDASISNLRKR